MIARIINDLHSFERVGISLKFAALVYVIAEWLLP